MNAIEIQGLSKTYEPRRSKFAFRKKGGAAPENQTQAESKFALKDLSLSLQEGSILGLIGENGAGKTTAIKLMLGMLKKDSGSVKLLGREVAGPGEAALKNDIGVVLDEVGIAGCLKYGQVDRVFSEVYENWDSAEFQRLAAHLDIPKDKEFRRLSRGNKMKVGLAAALSHHPKLLILDEATNGLDPLAREKVVELIFDFTRKPDRSVIFSSHIVSDLEKLCDYVAFLHKGELLLFDEKDRILDEHGILRCDESLISALSEGAVLGLRKSSYGVEALVRRDSVPASFELGTIGLEDIFIFMVTDSTPLVSAKGAQAVSAVCCSEDAKNLGASPNLADAN